MNKLPLFISLIAFIGGLVFAQQYFSKNSLPASKQTPIAGKEFGGEFTLQPEGGDPVSLSDFKGKVVVMYFGFASCPDVCPTSLAIIGSAMRSLISRRSGRCERPFYQSRPRARYRVKILNSTLNIFIKTSAV